MKRKNKNHNAVLSARKALRLIMLFALMCAFTCLGTAGEVHAKTYKIKSAADWKNISKYNGGTFKLTKNISLNKKYYLTIKKNKKYTIDLNRHNVTTTYTGKQLRSVCPLVIEKGTVILKSSRKNDGILYSTETAAVTVGNKAKFYLKSGMIMNDAVEFRSNQPSGIYMTGKSKVYLQGDCAVFSIGNAITMMEKSQLYTTGHPCVRAGYSDLKGQFTHYGSGINIASPGCKVSLKGGSFGTMASPPATVTNFLGSYEYQMSGDFPIYDKNGKTLKTASGYMFVDSNAKKVSITSSFDYLGSNAVYYLKLSGASPDRRLTTTVKDQIGCYTVYIVKK